MSYKLKIKGKTGYKGQRLTDENVSLFPQRLLDIWEKAGIIVRTKSKNQPKKENNGKKDA